ncbi:conserved exported hypothetical protein [Candidatus Sulfotelmatobacter kueseliae]|uniref:Uncharacterized protein n=1 Tax=Candidatus Sulfotelmatobacter kueseliae TaxID=2042962 RepID=A0A2U3KYC8_9BACT|nr:conserved exported hypothetical protein [Candidatus Sulfotelmatobacter kueseliae]
MPGTDDCTKKAGSHRRPRLRRAPGSIAFVGLLLLGSLPLLGAQPATVTFSLNFPDSDPDHYSISVQSDGNAVYECSGKISNESDDREAYQAAFKFTEATRARIFDLAAQAGYFAGKIDSGKKNLAFTGSKRLAYKDAQRDFVADYNFSPQPAVQQLTALFQSVATTVDFGRRLTYYHRYQKLALDDELKRMEEQARRGDLAELQAVRPILEEIFDDPSVMNVVRARAQRIMEMGKSDAARPR